MSKIVYIGRDLIEKGQDFVVAKVVDTHGSTPRKKGRMAPDGAGRHQIRNRRRRKAGSGSGDKFV